MTETVPSIPPFPNDYDNRRSEHTALRFRMLSGEHIDDVERALTRHVDEARRQAWGIPEISRCPFGSICQQVGGVLYRQPPQVLPPTTGDGAGLLAEVDRIGLWPLQQYQSTALIGLREVPMRIDWTDRDGLVVIPLEPQHVALRATPGAPDVPVAAELRQLRRNPESKRLEWTWEILDVENPDDPKHQVLNADRTADLTELYLPELDGYQYRDRGGRAFLPIVLYHAERTGRLWDPWYGSPAVMGTLTLDVLMTFWVHGVKDHSFLSVLGINLQVGGDVEDPGTGRRMKVVNLEPGAILEAVAIDPEAGQPTAIPLQGGFDPEKTMNAIASFETGLAEYAGVSPSDLVRTGADPRSGISLSISNAGLRRAQARAEPQLRRGDLEVLATMAKVANRATRGTSAATNYPESGWQIAYTALPKSPEELRAEREDLIEKMDRGLISRVDAYQQLHPGLTKPQALAELQRIALENAQINGGITR